MRRRRGLTPSAVVIGHAVAPRRARGERLLARSTAARAKPPTGLFALALGGALLLAQAASAQEPRPERLYLNHSSVLLGSSRVLALGGAYVGVAEGASGFASNLAALAHRSPRLTRDWDVGFTLSYLDIPLASSRDRDLDNDGRRDEAQATRQLLGGIMLQYKRFGLGWYFRSTHLAYCPLPTEQCPGSEYVMVDVANTALAGAVALGRDDFIAALGIYGAEADFTHHGENRRYGDTGIELDVLYRPHGLNYRIGMSVKPQVVGFYRSRRNEAPFLAGRQLYSAVVSPAVLSLGGSIRLGEGSHLYNRLSPAARRDILARFGEAWVPPEDLPFEAPGRWLLSFQVDLIAPTEDTVPISAFIDPSVAMRTVEPEPIGRESYVTPRVGVEHETLPGRMRTRLGTFVEPTPFPGKLPRPHLTGGLELFALEYWDRWSVSAAFDFAARYYNVGLSIGFWR